jgi:peptide/nickel transport system substrate-binding protein
METIWHLREDVYWHDGRPFTAADVVFSWRVLNDATIPVATRRVARMIDSVESLDQHTVLMRWRTRYAYADHLTGMELTLLPSHLLEATFDLRREQLAGHPYWRREFVGLGPFRLVRWPPGASIELAAFDRYFLGKPALSEIHVRFLPDDNTAMAGALTGQVDILLPRRGVHGVLQTVRDRWRDGSEGTLSVIPDNSWVFLSPQFHAPQPDALLDVRVRQALVMMIDREALAEVVAADRSLASHLWVPAADPRYSGLMASTVTYPYDPVRARELLREAGWRREGAEDILVKEGHRFDVELASTAEWERPRAAVEDYWRQSGVTVKDTIFALSSVIDRQGRAVYSGVELAGGMPNLSLIEGRLHSSNMPTANTQWVGANRGHYSSPILDGLLDRVRISLADRDRDQAEGEIARYISTELPVMSLFFYPSMAMVRNTVDGVSPPTAVAPVGRLSISWNGHQWRRSQLASAGSASDP